MSSPPPRSMSADFMAEVPACHARTGVSSDEITRFYKFLQAVGFLGTFEDILEVAEFARQGFTWAAGAFYLKASSASSFRRRILRTLIDVDGLVELNLNLTKDRSERHPELPFVMGSVDCAFLIQLPLLRMLWPQQRPSPLQSSG
eukprot:GILI01064577.1.p1 GENE.GILI01064577.1~~GILI01064577.1.p1  ORF type:complete len:162 (-),score=1.87 GILI01064577.1:134-568(-)